MHHAMSKVLFEPFSYLQRRHIVVYSDTLRIMCRCTVAVTKFHKDGREAYSIVEYGDSLRQCRFERSYMTIVRVLMYDLVSNSIHCTQRIFFFVCGFFYLFHKECEPYLLK